MRTFALVALFCVMFSGCHAEDEIKQGADGEYCTTGDFDCREGHICDRGTCRLLAIEGYGCEAMCLRIEQCGAQEPDCLASCLATTAGDCSDDAPCPWSDDAVEAFGMCIIDDLTCAEIVADDAPQLCYTEIPLDAQRADICDNFEAAIDICNPGEDTEQTRSQCYRLARTATNEGWVRVFECTARINDGLCAEVEECLNSVFLLDPVIDLGDGEIAMDELPE